ncbi:MAG: hypothetical protein J5516_04425 [Bacteroidales bacterium]|nr:hypothetical protein [Bacteroidales bacterium]
MKRTALFSLLLLLSAVCAQAQYVSPGTGEKDGGSMFNPGCQLRRNGRCWQKTA